MRPLYYFFSVFVSIPAMRQITSSMLSGFGASPRTDGICIAWSTAIRSLFVTGAGAGAGAAGAAGAGAGSGAAGAAGAGAGAGVVLIFL